MKRNLLITALLSIVAGNVSAAQFIVYSSAGLVLPETDVAQIAPVGPSAYQIKFTNESDAQLWQARWNASNVKFEADEPIVFFRERADTVPHAEALSDIQPASRFNDPLLGSQTEWSWSLNSIKAGVDAQRSTLKPVNVAVLDVGSLPHEDLLPVTGYSFTTYGGATASDNYTANSTNAGQTCSSAHGNNMMGIIGATRGNSKGIAGLSSASLYVGRVLATDCLSGNDVGLLSDLANGIYWATGASSAHKIPKADFINISVAAQSHCPAVLQNAINAANDAGTVVVVSAGNYSDLAEKYAPANCQGVVVVSAHNEAGQREGYANYGDRLTMTVGGSRLTVGASGYERVNGTSGAAAAVTGMLASIKQSVPTASNHQVLEVFKSALTKNKAGCEFDCGLGYANFSAALFRAEKVFEPSVVMKHAFGAGEDCKQVRQLDGLVSFINGCRAYSVAVNSLYADDVARPARHEVRLLRRSVNESSWINGRFETMGTLAPKSNSESFPWLDVDPAMYEYGTVACDGDYCPYPTDINVSSIQKPSSCK